MIETSDSIKAISKALLTFQGAVDGVEKKATNPHFGKKYANLESVRDTSVPELQLVGVFYIQSPGQISDGNIVMTTRLIHAESGEWMQGTMEIPLGKKDPQGAGSAITYASRYHLMAMLGLPPVDDDGEGAVERTRPQSLPAPSKPVAKPNKDDEARALYTRLSQANAKCATKADFNKLWGDERTIKAESQLTIDWQKHIEAERRDKFAELEEREPSDYIPPSFENPDPIDELVGINHMESERE